MKYLIQKKLQEKIDQVILSYSGDKNFKNNEILIQEMARNIKFSGVLTNVNKENGAPYIIINYSEGKKTNVVTSGKQNIKSFNFYKYTKKNLKRNF